ncbi:hypothetical protein H4R35_003830 [Dimargaris xerosporica]|nr:hypothetical protein H4R35_003830 [Dimargaris xerosporica]
MPGTSGNNYGPIQYFQDMRTMFVFHNLMNTLRANSIVPVDPFSSSDEQTAKTSYPLKTIKDTIEQHTGAKPLVICDSRFNSQLIEIRVYHFFDHHESSISDIARRAIDPSTKSNCAPMVKFLDKYMDDE